MKILAIGCGGFIGAIFRYLISSLMAYKISSTLPWATLVVNVIGAILMGYGTIYFQKSFAQNDLIASFFLIGILGAFTTFSAFSLETVQLIDQGRLFFAMLNILFNVVLCLLGIIVGRLLYN